MKITVLYFPDDICTCYTLYPLLRSRYVSMFDFTTDMEKVFSYKKNKAICVFRFFRRNLTETETISYFRRLRDHYEKILYFEDTPDPRHIFLHTIDLVDIYYKKSVLKDKRLYTHRYYGNTLYSDYYHRKFGVSDPVESWAEPLTDRQISKIRLAWNIGIGQYPKTRLRRAISRRLIRRQLLYPLIPFLGHPGNYRGTVRKKSTVCPLRFRTWEQFPSLSFQRELFSRIASTRPDLFSIGKISLSEYNRELRESKLTFASFGQGEICFRDFESVINFSLNLKPDMDHLETWPDIYKKNDTYIPLKWDGSDFIEKVEYWRDKDITKITNKAFQQYIEAFDNYRERLEELLDEVH